VAGTVTAKAFVNDKLTLTIVTPNAPQTVDFGNVDPGVAQTPQAVNLTVQSNRNWAMSISKVGDATMGLTTSLGSASGGPTASAPYVDTYSLTVPWTTAPGAITATVQYTVTQS
jgi:hypothetical protein